MPQARLVAPAAGAGAVRRGAPGAAPAAAVPRARMVSTDSRLLFEVLDGVYADLGFGALGDEVFRDLVLARVVEPTSLAGRGPGAGGAGPQVGQRPVHAQAHAAPLLRRELP